MSEMYDPAEVDSPGPGVPQTADKAKVGAIVAGIGCTVLLFLVFYLDEKNGTNFTEFLLSVLGGLGVAVPAGYSVYKTKNRPKHPHHNQGKGRR